MRNSVDNISSGDLSRVERSFSFCYTEQQCEGVVEVSLEGEPLYKGRKLLFWLLSWLWFIMSVPYYMISSSLETVEADISMSSSTSGLILGLPSILLSVVIWVLLIFLKDISLAKIIPILVISDGLY